MAKNNYISGLSDSEKKFSSLSLTELKRKRSKYIAKFKYYEAYPEMLIGDVNNRLDYYCGVIDYLTNLINKQFKKGE